MRSLSAPSPVSWTENPERLGLLKPWPFWFQPASKKRKNSLSQDFSTSASRLRKEQEVQGRVKIERKEELKPLHIKSSETSSACHSTRCAFTARLGTPFSGRRKPECDCWFSDIQHRLIQGQLRVWQKTSLVPTSVSLPFTGV